ncbi:hypothetical protein GCM10009001_04680 [Virgibacillus siamensis]|uniref:F5/8 type C domain-containing protein n=1 Tax=Virgibacillus siamensis TaxID=480071 RepID=A0ABP3QN57_9BACI
MNGQAAEGDIQADYRTVLVTSPEPLQEENMLDILVENIWGDAAQITKDFLYHEDRYAAKLFKKKDLVNGDDLNSVHFDVPDLDLFNIENKTYKFADQAPLTGKTDFSISLKLRTAKENQTILEQECAYSLAIDENGYLNFTVGDVTVNSKSRVTTVDEKASGTFGTEEYQPTTTNQTEKVKVNDGNLHDVKAVREANGLLKIYVDGKLLASKYVKNEFSLPKGEITLGGEETTMQAAEVEIKNKSIPYDEAQKSFEELKLIEGYRSLDRTGYKAYADSEELNTGNYEGPVENVLDGDKSTWWHTQYIGSRPTVPHWITIEMPEVKPVDAYKYVSRNGNGDVKSYKLQISDTNKDGSWTTIKSGIMKDSGSTLIEFDEPVEAKYYRLYITETYGNPLDTFAAAAEIKLYEKIEGTSDFSELAQPYEEITSINEAIYTDESLENSGFNALKEQIKKVFRNPNSTQQKIDEAVLYFNKNYEAILDKLVKKSDEDDDTPPAINAVMNGKKLDEKISVPDSETVQFSWKAKDKGSGLANVSAEFDGETYKEGSSINLAGKPGEHKLVVTAEDKAGNTRKETYKIQVTTSASDMKKLVEQYEKNEEIKGDAAHKLSLQLITVRIFEKEDAADKVIKHLNGLNVLMGRLKKDDSITEEVYKTLQADVDYLINKYQ